YSCADRVSKRERQLPAGHPACRSQSGYAWRGAGTFDNHRAQLRQLLRIELSRIVLRLLGATLELPANFERYERQNTFDLYVARKTRCQYFFGDAAHPGANIVVADA